MTAAGATAVAAVAAVVLLLSAVPGGGVFATAVLLLAVATLLLLHVSFSATGHRPVLLAAAVGGLGSPLLAALDRDASLEVTSGLVAASLLAAFVLALVGRRRHGVAMAIGATGVCALLVGLGSTGLIVLRNAESGFRWTIGVLALTTLPELAAAIAQRMRPDDQTVAVGARVMSLGVVGGALLAVANPPLGILAVVALALAAGATALGSDTFMQAVALEGGTAVAPAAAGLRWALAVMATAPLAFVVERALQA